MLGWEHWSTLENSTLMLVFLFQLKDVIESYIHVFVPSYVWSPRVTLLGIPHDAISQYMYFSVYFYVSFYFPCHWIHFAFWALFIGSFLWYSVVVMSIAEILVIYNTWLDLQKCLYPHCVSSHINTHTTPCCQNNKKVLTNATGVGLWG